MLLLKFLFLFRALDHCSFIVASKHVPIPAVELKNCAREKTFMPAVGLGTGCSVGGCDPRKLAPMASFNMSFQWLKIGGRRFDGADSYGIEPGIGKAIKMSGIPREEVFIVSKTGPGGLPFPLGYNETVQQVREIVVNYSTTYIDLVLIHYPVNVVNGKNIPTTDISCDTSLPTYSEKQCRLNTWKALVNMYEEGLINAIGVSNYNSTHIQEIIDARLPLPSVNQVSFSPYHGLNKEKCTYGSVKETCGELIEFCKQHSIVFNGYSPFGSGRRAKDMLEEPKLVEIAKRHNVSSAQVVLNWQWSLGIPVNPETASLKHQKENLDIFSFKLSTTEKGVISRLHSTSVITAFD